MRIPRKEQFIMQTLLNAGFEAYIVGGAVRDIILNRTPNDFDIATNALPSEIINLFVGKDFKINYVGTSFGVVMIDDIEVATYRSDVYHGNGHKDVDIEFVSTLKEDLARRDFTINAMAMDINGVIFDPFNGYEDLTSTNMTYIKAPYIRFVGDAKKRIDEDPNRILRAIRLCTILDGSIITETAFAMFDAIKEGKFEIIAPERIRIEILKTMAGTKKASRFWNLLKLFKITDIIFPELNAGYNHEHGKYHDEDIWEHNMIAGDYISTKYPLLKLAAYFHDIGKPFAYDKENKSFHDHQKIGADIIRKRLTALKFSNDEIRYIVNLVLIHMDGTRGMRKKARRKLKNKLHRYGLDWKDYIRLRVADRTANLSRSNFTIEDIKAYIKIFTEKEEIPFSVNALALKGGEIIKIFNIPPSPTIGKIQRHIYQKVVEGTLDNDKENLIIYIDKNLKEIIHGWNKNIW